MENWKEEELQSFLDAFKSANLATRGVFEAMLHPAARLFSTSGSDDSSFNENRRRLRENVETLSIPNGPNSIVLRELAIGWAVVNIHADTSDDDWFEASVELVFRLGGYCQSLSGLEAFLWHYELGKQLCFWQQAALHRMYGGNRQAVERLLVKKTDHSIHPTTAVLRFIPNMLEGLGAFMQSEIDRKQWVSFGSGFFGRLLFTHALCTGIGNLEDEGGLRPYLSLVNGTIASWPYPWPRDQDFTIALIEKMRSPHYVPQVEPGYFESEAWCQRLLAASREYHESFQRLFCEGDARDSSKADDWRQLGAALQVFSELVLVYDIDNYRKP